MLVRVGKHRVDVCDDECPKRPCFWLGFHKGTYVKGRGYTSHYKKPRPVCWTRHIRGCPENSICPRCDTVFPNEPGTRCPWCKEGVLEER